MRLAGLFLTAVLLFASPSWAQMKARINWTAVTGAQSGVFIAQQEGLFKKNGLDVELIHIPSSSRGIQAILAGQIDGGVVSPPTNSRARKAGFNELTNLAKDGPEYVSVGVGTSRAYIKANEDIVRRVVRSYAEAVYVFKTNKSAALRMMQKYLRVKEPDIQEDTYNQFREYLESIPFVSRKGLEAILTELAATEPQARQAKAEDFMDMRFMNELEKEGFFKKLWDK